MSVNLLIQYLVVVVIAGAGLLLTQLWFKPFGADTFFKLLVTFGVLAVVIGFLIGVKGDLAKEKELRDDKYLD